MDHKLHVVLDKNTGEYVLVYVDENNEVITTKQFDQLPQIPRNIAMPILPTGPSTAMNLQQQQQQQQPPSQHQLKPQQQHQAVDSGIPNPSSHLEVPLQQNIVQQHQPQPGYQLHSMKPITSQAPQQSDPIPVLFKKPVLSTVDDSFQDLNISDDNNQYQVPAHKPVPVWQ